MAVVARRGGGLAASAIEHAQFEIKCRYAYFKGSSDLDGRLNAVRNNKVASNRTAARNRAVRNIRNNTAAP